MTRASLPPKVCVDQLEEVIDAQEAEFYALERAMTKQKAQHASIVQSLEDKIDSLYTQLSEQRSKLKTVLATALDGLTDPDGDEEERSFKRRRMFAGIHFSPDV